MKDKRLRQVLMTLAFLRSVILSGEPMTEEIRNAINKACENLENVDKEIE